MNNKPKKKSMHNWITVFVILFAFILVFWISSSGVDGKQLSLNEAQNHIRSGEITHIYAQSGIAKMISKSSEIDPDDFPNNAEYYFEYTTNDDLKFIDEYNEMVYRVMAGLETDASIIAEYTGKAQINYVKANPTQSFISSITPYISIVIMVIIGVLLFKMFSGKGNAVGGFNKSRAKLVEKSDIRFNQVAGADEEKEEVQEIVEFLKNPAKFKALGARIPKGVLLVGPPGTGKTLLAKAVAGESNVPFLSTTGSDFVELYVGVGAGRVRDLFNTAKKCAPCIVFIDEIDAVGRQRGAGLGGGNDEKEQTLNQLLVEMDGFESNDGVIVLAATNRADVLDPALLRPGRFDRQIYVNVPDVRGREGILKIHAKNKPIDDSVNFEHVARLTSGFTGADLENVLNEAAILAARGNRYAINMEDITEGINKVLMGPQKKSRLITPKDKLLTAYHESGHAILAKKLDSGENVHEVSIIPRGMAGGYTSTRPADDDEHYTLNRLNNRICMLMGGRIAEELKFGDITAGASSDISKATEIARKMVVEWGMSEKLGFLSFGKQNEVFIGRDYQTQVNYSEQTASLIDSEIKRIIDENYQKASQILKDNMDVLENMSNLLLEKETIYQREVDEIMAGKNYKDIVKRLNREDKARKKKNETAKLEQERERALKMQLLKEQAAEALNNAGVISKDELEKIKAQSKQLKDELIASEQKAQKTTKASSAPTNKSETENQNKVEEQNLENTTDKKEE